LTYSFENLTTWLKYISIHNRAFIFVVIVWQLDLHYYLCNHCILPLMSWLQFRSFRGVLHTTLSDTTCQWLAVCRFYSPVSSVSSTIKTDRQDITDILLKGSLTLWLRRFVYNRTSCAVLCLTLFHDVILTAVWRYLPFLFSLRISYSNTFLLQGVKISISTDRNVNNLYSNAIIM
jgi:hypothetical protein